MGESNGKRITFTRNEAAKRLGISVVTLDRELARRRIPHLRIGRRVLFTDELLRKYIEENTEACVASRRGRLAR